LIVSNFDSEKRVQFELKIPSEIIKKWNLTNGTYVLKDQLYNQKSFDLKVENSQATLKIVINPLESFILKLQ